PKIRMAAPRSRTTTRSRRPWSTAEPVNCNKSTPPSKTSKPDATACARTAAARSPRRDCVYCPSPRAGRRARRRWQRYVAQPESDRRNGHEVGTADENTDRHGGSSVGAQRLLEHDRQVRGHEHR